MYAQMLIDDFGVLMFRNIIVELLLSGCNNYGRMFHLGNPKKLTWWSKSATEGLLPPKASS